MTGLLPTHPFAISYGPTDDRLHDFYLPALERSIQFSRTTGFFSSAALAVAAAGVARLIANGGKMRLLCGAQLSRDDVEAVRKGSKLGAVVGERMAGCLAEPTDKSLRGRLEALAWMVATGTLEIRVVLPKGADGLPLPADRSREYYHPKEGVFTDSNGNRLAFSGSSNDSEDGWQWNYEVFQTFASWARQLGQDEIPHGRYYIDSIDHRFDRLWQGEEDDWVALSIPDAAKQKLLRFRPSEAPTADPLEREEPHSKQPDGDQQSKKSATDIEDILLKERMLFRFLRDAPFMPNAGCLGLATSAVTPWPHQERIVNQVVERFPESFLFCDEVGLGKTIEAGLTFRQLYISGRVRRALVLVPKGVLRQWQEELYEKFALNVPRYDGRQLLDVFDEAVDVDPDAVWAEIPLLLASSQLAKRKERRDAVVAGPGWDLVIIDEAHHARRKDFLDPRFRPNRLLELLRGFGGQPGLVGKTRCLYLLTATPMQVHPVEVWDLLRVAGLGGRWGATQSDFLRYFAELGKPARDRDWDFLFDMVCDFLDAGGELEPAFREAASGRLGPVEWQTVEGLPRSFRRESSLAQLSEPAMVVVEEMLRRCTPVSRLVWRNTRSLLRDYVKKGLLKANVPVRRPENVWIELRPGPGNEQALYDRIEEYISKFYAKYEETRKGRGFIMTVYRRRLTSSFYALRRSLERRRDYLLGEGKIREWLTDEDVEQDDLELDVSEELAAEDAGQFKSELEYIEDFLSALAGLGGESKLGQLHEDVRRIFGQRETVILFTQYTDTMDHLRDELRHAYGSLVACYSGRGGERWDGVAWQPCPKEDLKAAFRKGDEVKILLCTESASEGLNLQTCGVLINYDMPWNPMRVEQRIGRIDRIGQKYPEVWIYNYFYQGTVEAIVYQRLSDRIAWFETVVGALQPILHRVERTIQKFAMESRSVRRQRLEAELSQLKDDIERLRLEAIDLDEFLRAEPAAEAAHRPPVTLDVLEKVMVSSRSIGHLFSVHPTIGGAHLLNRKTRLLPVTFRPAVFDQHPNSTQLLTYGNPLLDELLASVPEPPGSDGGPGVRAYSASTVQPLRLVVAPTQDGVAPIATVEEFETAMSMEPLSWTTAMEDAGRELFVRFQQTRSSSERRYQKARLQGERLALVEAAKSLLVEAALIELARAQHKDLFNSAEQCSFGPEVVVSLSKRGVPYKALLKIVGSVRLAAESTHPLWKELQGAGSKSLEQKWVGVGERGHRLVAEFAAISKLSARGGERLEALEEPSLQAFSWLRSEACRSPKEGSEAIVIPFRRVTSEQARPFHNCVPVYGSLSVAAGRFSPEQLVEEVPGQGSFPVEDYEWGQPGGRTPVQPGLFIAQISGESMNRRIPNGAWCLWRANPPGPLEGKVVLAEHRDMFDADLGGQYTVKVYHSEMAQADDGATEVVRVVLSPASGAPAFMPLVFEQEEAQFLRVVAELVEVLGTGEPPGGE